MRLLPLAPELQIVDLAYITSALLSLRFIESKGLEIIRLENLMMAPGDEKLRNEGSPLTRDEHDSANTSQAQRQTSSLERDVHYTVFVRLPFPRGDFVDPALVSLKERDYVGYGHLLTKFR